MSIEKPLDGRVAIVTGGDGFIGSHMVDLLVEHGMAVRVIDMNKPPGAGGKPGAGKQPAAADAAPKAEGAAPAPR